MNKRKIKSIIKYLTTIFSWAFFVILIVCAVFLMYYYLSEKLHIGKDTKLSIYTIVSPSMVPKINVYDVIVNKDVDSPEEIKEGDIITFISSSPISAGMTVTHRVKEVIKNDGEYEYVTKGDNNPIPDESTALYRDVIGKAYMKLPGLGRIQFFVASKFGWLLVVVIPALYIIIKDVLKLIKVSRVQKDAQKANAKIENSGIIEDGGTNERE